MPSVNGNITLNSVNDREMEKIWGFKAKHGHTGAFNFQPNAIQVVQNQNPAMYNNVVFTYNSLQGLNLLTEIVNEIHKKEETKAVGQ
jgi:hypothetical protein